MSFTLYFDIFYFHIVLLGLLGLLGLKHQKLRGVTLVTLYHSTLCCYHDIEILLRSGQINLYN